MINSNDQYPTWWRKSSTMSDLQCPWVSSKEIHLLENHDFINKNAAKKEIAYIITSQLFEY